MSDNNFFTQGMNMQKSMFDMWNKTYENFVNTAKPFTNTTTQGDSNSANLFMDATEAYKNFMSNWTDSFKKFQPNDNFNFFKFNDQQDLLKKMFFGTSVYQDLFSFWKDLSEKAPYDSPEKLASFYNDWQEKYTDIIKSTFISMLPADMRLASEQYLNLMSDYKMVADKFLKPLFDTNKDLKEVYEKMMKGDKDSYLEFFKLMNTNYNDTLSKILNISSFGLNKDGIEDQLEGFDSYIKFINSSNEMFALIYKISTETMETIVNQYQDMMKNGTTPKTFKEFYEMWIDTSEKTFVSFFSTPEFSKIFCQLAEKFCEFKIKSDKLMEEQLKILPFPTKTDMNSLYKTVYTQKKEIRSLKKDIETIKEKLNELIEKTQK